MDSLPREDPTVQYLALLQPPSRQRPRRVKPNRAPRRTVLLLTLGIFHVACNVAILVVAFHRYRFGSRVGKDSWWVTDNVMLSVIEPCSTLLHTITALLGGWAMSHLWSRRLSNRSAGGLAELQSLQIYQSIPTILSSIAHIFSGHYISAQWLYAAVITSAILLNFYTTAIVTLITPTVAIVDHSTRSYYFLEAPLMSSPGYGSRCLSSRVPTDVIRSCLEITLSGTAFIDAEQFDGSIPWTADSPWVEVDTTYTSPGRFVSAAIPLGPANNHNFSDGAMLYGINMATVERMSNDSSNLWDSFTFETDVTTLLPALTSQCARQDSGNTTLSTLNIHGTSYTLSTSLSSIPSDTIIAQVTSDNMTLIISIPSSRQPASSIHCAVNLTLQEATLTIIGTDSEWIPVTAHGLLLAYPAGDPWGDRQAFTNNLEPEPHAIREFADAWLSGLGWGSTPVPGNASALAEFLGAMPVGTGGLEPVSGSQILESYILVMLSNGIGAAFSPETQPVSEEDFASATQRPFLFYKSEYFLGITSKWQYFYVGIIILDSIFVILCTITILTFGWFPNFADPVTFARAAVCSGSGLLSLAQRDQSGATAPVFSSKSPIPLVNGEGENENLWKECFILQEVVDGDRRVLVFEPAALAETEDLDCPTGYSLMPGVPFQTCSISLYALCTVQRRQLGVVHLTESHSSVPPSPHPMMFSCVLDFMYSRS
ncbi:hypothetical protein NLI96_g4408 [Meripilus lineatus]|uniref:Uncharacterized protein n=1 Tax=Meripilus lineatus TaxID=2056292 RepID=A0AAD5V4L7_9APHY|nr:hypothetical protein NLI96_g4408 [Physisporinus lineatus]